MEFITVEQFKEQSKEIQKIFLDWWECDYGDLYYYNEDPLEYKDVEIIDNNLECDLNGDFEYFKSIGPIPLFTEGQLRKFIEDKTESKISISPSVEGKYWIGYDKYAENEDGDLTRLVYTDDVLSGLWKIACSVAKEG